MGKQYVTLVAPEQVIEQLVAAASLEGVELGKSRPADPLADAVDSPLGPEEIKALLQVLTVAFTTGSAALAFFERLKKLIMDRGDKLPVPVTLREGPTSRLIAKIDQDTDPEELARKFKQ